MSDDLYAHQREAIEFLRDRKFAALRMEMGTGKSRIILEDAQRLFKEGQIDCLLIVCPNGVQQNWILEQVPRWVYTPHEAMYYSAGLNSKEKEQLKKVHETPPDRLRIFAFNVESLTTKTAMSRIMAILNYTKTYVVIDESHRIKGQKTKVATAAMRMKPLADYRRIMSGTMSPHSPLDLWNQYHFLSAMILPYANIYAYRADFCVLENMRIRPRGKKGEEREVKQVVGFKNLDRLRALLAPHTFYKRKRDCLDLPEKVFETVHVPFVPEQRRMYKQMLEESVADLETGKYADLPPEQRLLAMLDDPVKAVAETALSRVVRLQQITAGTVRAEDGLWHNTPTKKHDYLLDRIKDTQDSKVIIWGHFKQELWTIYQLLGEEYGEGTAVLYTGDTPQRTRTEYRKAFQDPDSGVRFFVGHPGAGGIGIDLTASNQVIWTTLPSRLEYYLQANDRAHRIGQTQTVTYTHLVIPGTIDVGVMKRNQRKMELEEELSKE